MNSGVKTALILLLVVAVMFGFAVVSQFSGGTPAGGASGGGDDPGDTATLIGPPLEFALTEVGYNPAAEDQLVRAFPGFFEVGSELNTVSFWFRQPHPRPIKAAVKGRSCSACTSARIAMLQADPLAGYVADVRAGRVPPPVGPAESLTASLLAAGVLLDRKLEWQSFDFDHPENAVTLPAAPAGGPPAVGLFQMIYKVTGAGPKTLDAFLRVGPADGAPTDMKFSVSSFGTPAFRLMPLDGKLAVGDLAEGAAPKQTEVVVWSATRRTSGPGPLLASPAVAVLPRDPFVRAGVPVPVPDADLPRVAAALEQDKQQPVVKGAWRVPLTVHRSRPADAPAGTPPEPDVGPFERQVAFAVAGEQRPQEMTLSGTMTGLVGLTDGRAIDLGSFPAASGSPKRDFTLVSDKPGLKLAVDAAGCRPKYATVTLGEPQDRAGRRFWTLSLAVVPGVALEEFPADSVVVLLADPGDGTPRRVKVPLKGRAFTRGGR